MDIYTVSEVAYKNGYEAGTKDFVKRLKEYFFYDLERECIFEEDIDNFVNHLMFNL